MAPFATQPHIFVVYSSPLILSSYMYHTNLAMSVLQFSPWSNRDIAHVTASTEKVCPLLGSLPKGSEIPTERIVPHRRDHYSGK